MYNKIQLFKRISAALILYFYTIFTITTIIFIVCICFVNKSYSNANSNSNLNSNVKINNSEKNSQSFLNDPLIKKNITLVEQGQVLTLAEVNDVESESSISFFSVSKIFKKTQDEKAQPQQMIKFFVLGLHKNSCPRVLPLMNRYEEYQKHIKIISESYYNPRNKLLVLVFDFPILPFQVMLQMQLERISASGNYPYILKGGIFPDLKGSIDVSNYKNRCLFNVSAYWQGAKSNIPNFILEIFLETVAKMALEKLFRISAP